MGLELNKKDRSSVKDVELFRVKDEVRVRSRPVTRIFPGGAKMGAAGEIFFFVEKPCLVCFYGDGFLYYIVNLRYKD